jgi:PadR family transcriptional regulator PadR
MENKYYSNWTSQLKKGILPYLILKLLQDEARYGYELVKLISRSLETGVTDGTLYPILIRMFSEGLLQYEWIQQASGIPRKYYVLTDLGRETYPLMHTFLHGFFTEEK